MTKQITSLLAKQRDENQSRVRFEKRNPADSSDLVVTGELGTSEDLELAITAAQEGFQLWKSIPAPKRAEVLYRAAELAILRKEELSQLVTRETGKPILEGRGETQELIDTLLFFAGEGRRLYGITGQSELGAKTISTIREPIGVCGLITAWNFPLAVPSWKIAPALIAGNSFILKPSEKAPLSGYALVALLHEAGLPHAVGQVLLAGKEITAKLASDTRVPVISFTGSVPVGEQLSASCGAKLKKCSLELGGKNAIVALADANRDLLLEGVLWGAFATAGQRCTSTSRLILEKSSWTERFLDELLAKTKNLKLGNGLKPETEIGPLIDESQIPRVQGYVDRALAAGASLLCGGKQALGAGLEGGSFYEPSIVLIHDLKSELWQSEVFGPVLAVCLVDTPQEALQAANDSEFGLSLSVYSQDIGQAQRFARDLEAGIVYINAPTIGAECGGASAFGGWKKSGNGSREGGLLALDTYTQYKTIYHDFSASLQRAQLE